MPTTKLTFSVNDNSNEIGTFGLHFPAIADDGGNYGQMFTVPANNLDTLKLVFDTATSGVIQRVNWSNKRVYSRNRPNDQTSQREIKIRFVYYDNDTDDEQSFELPSPNIAALLASGTDEVDFTKPVANAIKEGVEQFCVSKNGNDITVTRGYLME